MADPVQMAPLLLQQYENIEKNNDLSSSKKSLHTKNRLNEKLLGFWLVEVWSDNLFSVGRKISLIKNVDNI